MVRPRFVVASCLILGSLLAGCVAPDDPVDREDGLKLEMAASEERIEPGEAVRVNATVVNVPDGNGTVAYRAGCQDAWHVRVVNRTEGVVHTERSDAVCLGFDPERLTQGEAVHEVAAWNGTRWNGSAWVPVDPGRYRVVAAFTYHDGEGEAREVLAASVPVQVVPGNGTGNGTPPRIVGPWPGFDQEATARNRTPSDLLVRTAVNDTRIEPGETVGQRAVATNRGDDPVRYREGCRYTWDHRVLHEGDPVQTHPDRVRCLGFQQERLQPDETLREGFTWNGTLWNGSAYVPAPAGNYTVQVGFQKGWSDGGRSVVWAGVNVTVTRS